MEMLEVATVVYEKGWHWSQVGPLLGGPLFKSYFIVQVLILSILSIFVLGYAALSRLEGRGLHYLANLGALMLASQVLVMRFNVVIGGQLISKSERGFVDFHWEIFAREGVLPVLLIFMSPFVLYYAIARFIPVLEHTGPKQ